MLITRPNHDLTTNYLFYWSQLIIKFAHSKSVSVSDLSKKRANVKEFESVIKKTKPNIMVLNGHGSESSVTGYNNEPLVSNTKNIDLLNNSTIYARSCRSAKKLGFQAVKQGCKAYIGYDDDFIFVTENEKATKPLDDKTAKLFLEPSNHIVISLLKGHSPDESNKRSKELYKGTIQKLMSSSATKQDQELIPHLVWDYLHQVVHT